MRVPWGAQLNIKQIRYFVSVYTCGSLSAAAKEQYVTVQAVSKAIADLERELKGDLFVRESRGVRPTPFGKSFFLKAEPVLRSFEELEAFALGSGAKGKPVLRLGLCSPRFYGSDQACESIATFVEKNLGIPVSVRLEPISATIQSVEDGALDACFVVGTYDHGSINCVPIGVVSPAVLMSLDHPLAGMKTVRVEDVKPYPVSVSGEFETFNNIILAEYPKRGVKVRYSEMSSSEFGDYFTDQQGLAFAVGIPALGVMYPHTTARLFAPEDSVAIPICLVTPKVGKSPACLAMEHWIAAELSSLGSDSFRKIAAMATSSR